MKSQKAIRNLLILAAGVMIALLCSVLLLLQMAWVSSILFWVLLMTLSASAGLVYFLVAFTQSFKQLEMRLDIINTGKDSVTGLPDPHKFEARVDVECRRCVREFMPLTLMYVGFDTEQLEDSVAIDVAENLMHEVYRPGDMVAKVDSTTFGFILPSTNELVRQLADRCLDHIRLLEINHTVSIGICTFQPTSELNVTVAMKHVDALLKQAKTEGGNRVVADAQETLNPPVTYSY
ncbi:GGDEF domain-containing protein [Neptunomonas antarctica]|uniref:GGDEF domain-containing protein, diguanylate cyclase (C-di-GMP synthetase) or its enzymatically inactive variants n=1 Tax=Neptunomonas antarctica TaxID=619304 RepID=A0A1N7M6Y6_9GAMM|nr:GGDEF domain-containing protein [Neptunomonas antarctica]SIS81848.1 GGDEF domain-containing protein, diguanylate cyclase (c-di-GMP synthetase) or its enzymatically inactive variants [Neptunomonas antarctica]